MALKKSITLDNGVSYEYHRISAIRLDITEELRSTYNAESEEMTQNLETIRRLYLNVLGYVSKDVRDSGIHKFVDQSKYVFELSEEASESNLRELGYNLIKTLEKYSGSEDC